MKQEKYPEIIYCSRDADAEYAEYGIYDNEPVDKLDNIDYIRVGIVKELLQEIGHNSLIMLEYFRRNGSHNYLKEYEAGASNEDLIAKFFNDYE